VSSFGSSSGDGFWCRDSVSVFLCVENRPTSQTGLRAKPAYEPNRPTSQTGLRAQKIGLRAKGPTSPKYGPRAKGPTSPKYGLQAQQIGLRAKGPTSPKNRPTSPKYGPRAIMPTSHKVYEPKTYNGLDTLLNVQVFQVGSERPPPPLLWP
jgi:hypothetical protein